MTADIGTHAELIAEARSYGSYMASDGSPAFAVAPHSLTLALAAALEEAGRLLAECQREDREIMDGQVEHLNATVLMWHGKYVAAEAALKVAEDALEEIEALDGATGAGLTNARRLAREALAAIRQNT